MTPTEPNGDEVVEEPQPNEGDEAAPNEPPAEPDTHRDAVDDEANERVERAGE